MTSEGAPTDPDTIKHCCAAAYGRDAVALVLGESYHPGGRALTRRLAGAVGLRPGARVADVATGPGDTARLLAAEYGAVVDGVDLGTETVRRARETTERVGLTGRVRFHTGDAERMPLPGESFDALVCECALCTFPDKPAAAAEFARLLRPGGRVGITDITVSPHGLPDELARLTGWIACLADARPLDDYTATLAEAGLRVTRAERHDQALTDMIDRIEARLKLLRMTAPERLANSGVDVDAVLARTREVTEAVADGVLGYALLTATKS
ncbi:Methyltransferase domain-containing protein [Actinopolyspora lacussalsi subsp. righensis]|uniref:Methyltransferase domain-containing protein n=1 Tax=Actinopolyspora righensis TaxID=995060 RepID=A0A1I7A8L2_9ACTN|nr:methyltransferase domain-containing protein [Actinopolyspora righensis]SFT71282.1 Methyltransferase domain-containing protein [Actinopolyspora righensis]